MSRPSPNFLDEITGRYDVDCPEVDRDWPFYTRYDLYVARSGSSLWAKFSLGVIEGVMRFPQPPTGPGEEVVFHWRGREDGGDERVGDSHRGRLVFNEDGSVTGEIDFMDIPFTAEKVGYDSPSAEDIQEEWHGYDEES